MTTPTRPSTGLRLNLMLLSIARHWMRIALTILAVYISLPWLAPTFMKLGLETPARIIYTAYRPFCHQFGFRSFFLYGEQPEYPLEAASAAGAGMGSFESYVGKSRIPAEMAAHQVPKPPFSVEVLPDFFGIHVPSDVSPHNPLEDQNFVRFQIAAAAFLGNPQMGYKMTLCERDIAIYSSMFIFGVIYSRPSVRRRLRPIPLWLYFFAGVAPIGIDGFSQLLGYPPFHLWGARETLPFFRVMTGILFGAMTGWLGFPYIEMSMRDAIREIEAKLTAAGIPISRS
ncbi:MAG TPA: DUF2085 domain-containing protein [Phototrophicaceae bacterium]|jgi:uncharacterized membrane protein|nr:DUF2085 domain-containing protein [Phototrophicaceae bacterium]